jgi:hypothetical protein
MKRNPVFFCASKFAFIIYLSCLTVLLPVFTPFSSAQQTLGSINGTVTDSSAWLPVWVASGESGSLPMTLGLGGLKRL